MNALGSSSRSLFTATRNLSRGEGISPDSAWVAASVGSGGKPSDCRGGCPRSPGGTSCGEQSCSRQHHMVGFIHLASGGFPRQTLKAQNERHASEAGFVVYLSKITCSINSGMKGKEAAVKWHGWSGPSSQPRSLALFCCHILRKL